MAASTGRWQRQAAIDAALKFSPTHAALAEQLREAQNTYGSTVRAGRSAARSTQQAAQAAKPEIGQIYQGADAAQQAGVTLVNQQLANLPGVDNQFKANQAAEVQTQLANLGSSRARDLSMLTQQGVSAQAGAQFNQQQARSALQQTVRQLFAKGQSTAGEEGAFAASEAGKLAADAEKLEQQERASERTANTSRTNAQEGNAQQEAASKRTAKTAAEGRNPAGLKLLSPDKQAAAQSQVATIGHVAARYLSNGLTRDQIVERLEKGIPSQSGKTKSGNAFKTPAVPSFKAGVLMEAALDTAEYGHVTTGTLKQLHNAGYSLKALGLYGPPAAGYLSPAVRESQRRGAGSRRA